METNWELASNTQLQEECKRLENEFNEYQAVMRQTHEKMTELSRQYVELKKILDKRLGKNKNGTK